MLTEKKNSFRSPFNLMESKRFSVKYAIKIYQNLLNLLVQYVLISNFCINCITKIKDDDSHKDHDYLIFNKLSFPVFHKDWLASEEIMLLTGIEKFGLDNWQDISDFIGSKSKFQCESHYYSFYYTHKSNMPEEKDLVMWKSNMLDEDKVKRNLEKEQKLIEKCMKIQGKAPESNTCKDLKSNNTARSIVKNKNRKDQNINTAAEILGYWKKREEFEHEYLNDAELEISELEFIDNENKEDKDLKLKVLKIYNKQLQTREKIKKFAVESNLLDLKKATNYERKLSKEDRDIYNLIKPLARFMNPQDFPGFFEGIILMKNIKQRSNQLRFYKSQGCKTYDDIDKFLEREQKNHKKDLKSNMSNSTDSNESFFTRTAKQIKKSLDFANMNNNNIYVLDEKEKQFVKEHQLEKKKLQRNEELILK